MESMAYILSTLSAVALVGCFFNPAWAACSYFAINIIRPNEHYPECFYPTIPAAIIVTAICYLVFFRRRITLPKGVSQRTLIPAAVMMCMLAAHLLVLRRHYLRAWFLGDFAPMILYLLLSAHYMSTAKRVGALFATSTLSSAYMALQALYIHTFLKGSPRPVLPAYLKGVPRHMLNPSRDFIIGYGEPWDSYHFDMRRLQSRGVSEWGNPNDFGMICNFAVTGTLYLVLRRGGNFLKLVGLVGLGLMLCAIILTGSRGNLLYLAVLMWLLLLGSRRKALGMVLLIVGLVGVLVVLPILAPDRKDAAESSTQRINLQLAAINAYVHSPVKGVGFLVFQDIAPVSLLPHNVYLQCLAETGTLGGLVYFLLLWYMRRETKHAVKLIESGPNRNFVLLAHCINAWQIAFMIFCCFSNQFMRPSFGVVLSLSIALYRTATRLAAEGALTATPPQAAVLPQARVPQAALPALEARRPAALLPAHDKRRAPSTPAATKTTRRYVYDPSLPRNRALNVEEDDE